MANEIVILGTYNEVDIHARADDGFIDATELCNAHGCKWSKFYELPSTKAYLASLCNILRKSEDMLIVDAPVTGNPGRPHKLVHKQIGLKCAAWIDPDFEVWVYSRIEELLTRGRVALPGVDQAVNAHVAQTLQNVSLAMANLAERMTRMENGRDVPFGPTFGVADRLHELLVIHELTEIGDRWKAKVMRHLIGEAARLGIQLTQDTRNGPVKMPVQMIGWMERFAMVYIREWFAVHRSPLFDE